MSRKSQRIGTQVKRERDESLDNNIIDTDNSSPSAKRQHTEVNSSRANINMSEAGSIIKVPVATLQVYHQMLPKNPEGVNFLFNSSFADALEIPAKRLAKEYCITEDEAIEEFRRLVAIKTFTVDQDATKISPTPLMDELWHAAILDTQFYAGLQDALGLVLHHRPSGAREQEAEQREQRLAAMKALYHAFFSIKPLESAPRVVAQPGHPREGRPGPSQPASNLQNKIEVCIWGPEPHHSTTFKVPMSIRLFKLVAVIAKRENLDVKKLRTINGSQRMEEYRTLEENGIEHGDDLELHVEQVGC